MGPLTLDDATLDEIGIPITAKYFAWSFPIITALYQPDCQDEPDLNFLMNGGFVYLDIDHAVVGIMALSFDEAGGLQFGAAEDLGQEFGEALKGRIHDITLPSLRQTDATHFCWVAPNEMV